MLDKPFSGYIYKVEGDCWSIRSHGSFFLESGSYVFIQDSKNQKCSGVIFDFQQINIFDNQYMEFSSQDLVAFPELEKIILFEYKAYQVTSSQGKPICNQAVLMHESLSYSFLLHNFNWLERIFLLTNNIYEQKKRIITFMNHFFLHYHYNIEEVQNFLYTLYKISRDNYELVCDIAKIIAKDIMRQERE